MLVLHNIEVKFNRVILVLRGVSLEVADRCIVALLGANGAGKTTTLKAISGLLGTELGEVTEGSITFNGHKIHKQAAEYIARLGIVQVLEGQRLFQHLTTEENLYMGGHIVRSKAMLKKRLDTVYDYFPRLKILASQICGYLSGGERQMLVIGRAMVANPKLMLLDEPSLGLSPLFATEIFGLVKRLNDEEKMGILLVEQNAMAALSIAEYAYVLENGRIVLDGPSQKLLENEDIKEFYLGLDITGKSKGYQEVKHYKRRKRWVA